MGLTLTAVVICSQPIAALTSVLASRVYGWHGLELRNVCGPCASG